MSCNDHCISEEDFKSFKSGHEHGFTALFNEWHVPICYFANSILGNMQEAEDVTEDCFLILWQRRNDFTSLLRCKSFLYTSVRNACISNIRHRNVIRSSQNELQYLHINNITLLDQVISSELARHIHDAIESLPLECRKIFHLLFREGKSNSEVAETLNLSVKTVKAQRQRGLSLLRKRILPLF
jgi:RNA polymerase sigma-70 factor (family 1)